MKITTKPYKSKASDYVKEILSQWLGKWWLVIAVPIILQLAMSLHNVLFIFTAFMTIFLLYPPILLFVYYFYALSPNARDFITMKSLVIDDNGINICFIDEEDSSITTVKQIDWTEISSIKYTRNQLIFILKSNNYQLLILPYSSVAQEYQQTLVAFLNSKNNYKK